MILLAARIAAGGAPIVLLLRRVPDRVLSAANRVLQLPSCLLCGTFGLRLGVAGHFADRLLDRTLHLMSSARDPIFVHDPSPWLYEPQQQIAFKVQPARWWRPEGGGCFGSARG